jgi:hypothetical protein
MHLNGAKTTRSYLISSVKSASPTQKTVLTIDSIENSISVLNF